MSQDDVKLLPFYPNWLQGKIAHSGSCWNWNAAKTSRGYGHLLYRGAHILAHRLMLLAYGRMLPADMVVDHTCRNKTCVNPNHLRVVTQRTNCIENSSGFAAENAIKTHCINGHELSGYNAKLVKRSDGTRRKCRLCQQLYRKKKA